MKLAIFAIIGLITVIVLLLFFISWMIRTIITGIIDDEYILKVVHHDLTTRIEGGWYPLRPVIKEIIKEIINEKES